VAALGSSAWASSACQADTVEERPLSLTTWAAAQAELQRLAQAPGLHSSAHWSWAQTLVHAAQSIEYSMHGFPQAKPRWFQATLGTTALQVFQWRGRMSHDRSEPIPGAPALDPKTSAAQALARLQDAIAAFQAWTGPLQPHFAYGPLDKARYEQAHAMHLAHHLAQFTTAA